MSRKEYMRLLKEVSWLFASFVVTCSHPQLGQRRERDLYVLCVPAAILAPDQDWGWRGTPTIISL